MKLVFKEIPRLQVQDSLHIQSPVAILSEIKDSDRKIVQEFLIQHKNHTLCRIFIRLARRRPELADLQIQSSDEFLKKLFTEGKANSIIRIGGIPTLEFWRDLEVQFKNKPVYSFSQLSFSGLSRNSDLYPLCELSKVKVSEQVPKSILSSDRDLQTHKYQLLTKFPKF